MSSERSRCVVTMRAEQPTEEGYYFVQYHRNFQPVVCQIWREDDGELWLHTKSTSKPLKEVKAYCYGSM